MGELIPLGDRRGWRPSGSPAAARPARPRVVFAFDACSPWTYLAAERVEHRFPGVRWLPVARAALGLGPEGASRVARIAIERRAAELGLPLVWPERGPCDGVAVGRVAALAADSGNAGPFVLAAGRLAYCGGYDLDDPDVLAEAAAAGGLDPAAALEAACDPALDCAVVAAGARMSRRGATALPALQVARTLFCGEDRISEAAALLSGAVSW
jgi:2-hydroxychromene-2-carboxylate isomerase